MSKKESYSEVAIERVDTGQMASEMTYEDVPSVPIMSVQHAIDSWDAFQAIVKDRMKEGYHYDKIPGTERPSLLDPGADLLCKMYGLSDVHPTDPVNFPGYVIERCTEDWDREPFLFDYTISCILYNSRTGRAVRREMASCNSWEDKYRWRQAQRICPSCGSEAIIKSKFEDAGWFCFPKKGGCGEKFESGDRSIEDQRIGRAPNTDIANQKNTILQMAQKRAKLRAVRAATLAGEMFTQDVEETLGEAGQYAGSTQQRQQPSSNQQKTKPSASKDRQLVSDSEREEVWNIGCANPNLGNRSKVIKFLHDKFQINAIEEITAKQYPIILDALRGYANGGSAPQAPAQQNLQDKRPIASTNEGPVQPSAEKDRSLEAPEKGLVHQAARQYGWELGSGSPDDPLHIMLKQAYDITSVTELKYSQLAELLNLLKAGPKAFGLVPVTKPAKG